MCTTRLLSGRTGGGRDVALDVDGASGAYAVVRRSESAARKAQSPTNQAGGSRLHRRDVERMRDVPVIDLMLRRAHHRVPDLIAIQLARR